MNILEYAQKLGVDLSDIGTAKPVDVEAGKAGYEKYLADTASGKIYLPGAYDSLENYAQRVDEWRDKSFGEKLKARWLDFKDKVGLGDTKSTEQYIGGRAVESPLMRFLKGELSWDEVQAVNSGIASQDFARPQDDWTDEERWAFGEAYAENPGAAFALAEEIQAKHIAAADQKKKENIAAWTDKNFATRTLGSLASLGINAAAGGVGYVEALLQKGAYGRTYDYEGLLPHEVANTMQGTVAENLSEKSKALGYIYNIGMSVGQSTLAGVTGGSAGALVQFFGMSASNGFTDAKARGADDNQALAFGTLSGLAEAIPEMISVDKFIGLSSSAQVEKVFKSILKKAGGEAVEEGVTSVLTKAADAWVMKGKSEYALTIQALMASGMSEAEAKNKALTQTLLGIAGDVVTGAISGVASGGIGVGMNRFNQKYLQKEANTKAKEVLTPEASNLISEGKKYDSTSKQAARLEQKMAEGKELSGYELRRLANELGTAEHSSEVDSVRQAIVEKMKAEGVEEKDAKRLGEIALNKALGNEVSKIQDVMLKRNEAALKVYNQIDAKNMASGESDSKWIEKTPLRKLRYEAEAAKNNANTESKPTADMSGVERLKAKALARKLTDSAQYKINDASLEGKFTVSEDDKVKFVKSSEESKIHTDEISSSLTKDEIAQIAAIEKLANELGVNIHMYESTKNKDGSRTFTRKDGTVTSDSGWYDPNDRSIHIDLRAGEKGEGTMLYTAAHELVHFMKDVSSEHYDALEKLVTAELVKGGKSVEHFLQIQRDSLIANGKKQTDADFEEVAREEMIADACMKFLASDSAVAEIKALKTKNKGLWNALKKFFTSFFNKINKIYKNVDPDSSVGKYIGDMHSKAKAIRDAFMEGVTAAGEKNNKTQTKQTATKAVKSKARSISKITAEMTDAERYEELKNKKITAPYYSGEVDTLIAEELDGKINNAAKKAVIKIAEKIGIPGTEINIKDIDVDIKISRSNLKESISKDATPEQIAKLLPVLLPTVEQSILVERHNNRYYYDYETVYFDNLMGAYVDGDSIVPVRFGLKHGRSGATTLYIVIDQNKIDVEQLNQTKKDIGHQAATPELSGESKSSRYVTYSISEIVPFVKSKDLLRYLPDQMLDVEQHSAKWKAIAETIKKTNEKNDKQYAEYISKGDERSARQMVKNAAKANGYTDVVYHGTKMFGFTEFDTEKSDDKLSLFAAGSPELAQTYSGKSGTKKISETKNIDSLSDNEVVKTLNEEAQQSYEGAELQTEYDIMALKDVNKLINEVNNGIDDLQKVLEGKIKEYADKMARDFDDKDAKTHSRLIEANELLKAYEYKRLSTPLYVLLHYTDAFRGDSIEKSVVDLEYKIRLMNKLTDADTSNGVVVKKDLGGYGVTVLTFDKAREELKGLISSGNYSLYGKPGRQLVIDAKGQNWNNIKNWIQSAYQSTKDTYVKKDDMYYRLYDSDTNEQIFHGRIEITDKNRDMSVDYIHPIMVQKANNALAIRSEYMKTTRDIAKFAKDEGYNSVKFINLVDNGGMGESVESGDVYVYFAPSDLKSADIITYDNQNNVIPLSERFNDKSKDIRHKSRGGGASLPYQSPTNNAIVTNIQNAYKPTRVQQAKDVALATQIAMVNAQAGIEKVGKMYGAKNIESLVQAARTAINQAQEMIGGNQYRIGSDTKTYLGEGLQKIIAPVQEKGEDYERTFYDYLFHYHNADRMSLERRSIEWNEQKKEEMKNLAQRAKEIRNEEMKLTGEKTKWAYKRSEEARSERNRINLKLKELSRELVSIGKARRKVQKEIDSFEALKNKPVIGLNHDEVEAKKAEISARITELVAEKRTLGAKKANEKRVNEIKEELDALRKERSELTAEVTEEKSREIIAEYEKNYPEFIEVAEKIWNYSKNLNQYRVDTGLIDQDTFDYLEKLYPHYVPTYRADTKTGIAAVKGKNNLAVSQSIRTATGSTKDLLNPIVIMARQTMETVRAGRVNQIVAALYNVARFDKRYIEEISKKTVNKAKVVDYDPTDLRLKPKSNQITFFKDGERITLQVSTELFTGFDAFSPQVDATNPLMAVTHKANDIFKKLVTSWNPFFIVRNSVRDIQDAGINTKYGKAFVKNYYIEAGKQIKNGGELWQLYKAMGGTNVNLFDFDKGFKGAQSKMGFEAGLMKKIANANAFVECLPRFAEFISSIEAGNTAEQAMLDAADVTTNFARTGTITKKLNSTIIPFLNPAIQGASKAVRNITSIRSVKDAVRLALKAAIVGILPFVLNDLLYDDDEDYEVLKETDKENNYLIKVGDKFFKLPRGRMASVLAGATNRTINSIEGEEKAWKGYLKNVSTQMNPVENMARTIFSPFMDVKNNVTWYGSAIEGREFENKSPAQRYDESTSSIAIAIGKVINRSPKKIHYILDQYSGVIGDFFLPMTTKKAEKGFVSGNFVIDPVTSNKLSDQFYDMYYDAQYAKSDNPDDKTAEYQVKHLNRVKDAISKLYDEKDKIQNSDKSNAEKRDETRTIQILINEMFKTALNDYELVTNAIEATSSVDDKYRYTEIQRLVYGAETALKDWDDTVYEKSTLLAKNDISYDNFYKYYFGIKGIESDKDKDGNSISGSKKKKVIEKIEDLSISDENKLLLIAYSGYTIDSEKDREKLLKYLNRLTLSTDNKKKLADMCGFKYKNGKIVYENK